MLLYIIVYKYTHGILYIFKIEPFCAILPCNIIIYYVDILIIYINIIYIIIYTLC